MEITARVCRAARVGLGISRVELAEKAGVAERTVIDFERGARDPITATKRSLRAALESYGVRFPEPNCICLPDGD